MTDNLLEIWVRLSSKASISSFKSKKYLVFYNSASGSAILEVIRVRKVEVIGIGEFDNIYLGFNDNLSYEVLLNGGMIC